MVFKILWPILLANNFLSYCSTIDWRRIFIICALPLSQYIQAQTPAPAPLLPLPSQAQLRWHQMEQYAFIHFTINTFTDKEWGFGDESPELFDPSSLDVNQWAEVVRLAGLNGIILTVKHHDGFCLWPSAFTNHNISKSPLMNGQADLVKMVSEACKNHNLKFGIYLSPWDRNHPDYGKPAYIEYYRNQVQELTNNYGPLFEWWLDGANGGDGYYGGARETRRIDGKTYYHWPETIGLIRKQQPDVLIFSDAGPDIRWVGNESGVAGETNWNLLTTDTLYAGKPDISALLGHGDPDGKCWIPAEVDVSIRPGWFWHAREDSLVKSPQQLFDIYLSSVGRGANLLLNIPPDRRGRIHQNDVLALREWKKLRDEAFSNNLAPDAKPAADRFRGQDAHFGPEMLIDNDPSTYWATDDGILDGTITLHFNQLTQINYIVLQEYINLGQRVKQFEVEYLSDGEWKLAASGSTIGYKRILKVGPLVTNAIRVHITDARACPVIANLEVY